jgi:hypothetical protein
MRPADVQLQIIKDVVQRFLSLWRPTPRIRLVKKVGDPDVIDELVPVILKCPDGEMLFPNVLSFECCDDPDALRLARKSVEIVIRVLQDLFRIDLEKTSFSLAEIEQHAQVVFGTLEPRTIRLGLYLVNEFSGVHAGMGTWPNISFVRVHEQIGLQDSSKAWDEHVKKYSLYLEKKQETPSGTTEPALSEGILQGSHQEGEERKRSRGPDKEESTSLGGKAMDPLKLLKEAIRAVPAVRYALGVAGLAAVVAIVLGLKLNPQVAVFGSLIVLALMFVLLVFSKYAGQPNVDSIGPARFLVWFYTVAIVVATILFMTSYFASWPLRFRIDPTQSSTAPPAEAPLEIRIYLDAGTYPLDQFLDFLSQSQTKVSVVASDLQSKTVQIRTLALSDIPLKNVLDQVLIPQLPGPGQWHYEVYGKTVMVKRR